MYLTRPPKSIGFGVCFRYIIGCFMVMYLTRPPKSIGFGVCFRCIIGCFMVMYLTRPPKSIGFGVCFRYIIGCFMVMYLTRPPKSIGFGVCFRYIIGCFMVMYLTRPPKSIGFGVCFRYISGCFMVMYLTRPPKSIGFGVCFRYIKLVVSWWCILNSQKKYWCFNLHPQTNLSLATKAARRSSSAAAKRAPVTNKIRSMVRRWRAAERLENGEESAFWSETTADQCRCHKDRLIEHPPTLSKGFKKRWMFWTHDPPPFQPQKLPRFSTSRRCRGRREGGHILSVLAQCLCLLLLYMVGCLLALFVWLVSWGSNLDAYWWLEGWGGRSNSVASALKLPVN